MAGSQHNLYGGRTILSDFRLPDGVKLMGGVEHMVRHSVIKFAGVLSAKNLKDQPLFWNPRWTEIPGSADKLTGNGLSEEDMSRLREEIRTQGLMFPLQCRWFPYQNHRTETPKCIQLVDGERRFRSINKLLESNAECYDRVTDKFLPAKKIYEWVPCSITEMTDDKALHIALIGNDTSAQISHGATIALVRRLKDTGRSDQDILVITGRSPDWLCKTLKLVALADEDPEIFSALCKQEISRTVAKGLHEIKDPKMRKRAFRAAVSTMQGKLNELKLSLEHNEQEKEVAETLAEYAEQAGDEEASRDAKEIIEQAENNIRRHKKRLSRPRAGITSGIDFRKASHVKTKPLTLPKAKKLLAALETIIQNNGLNPETKEVLPIDMDDAVLAVKMCNLFEQGLVEEPDALALRILSEHKEQKSQKK